VIALGILATALLLSAWLLFRHKRGQAAG